MKKEIGYSVYHPKKQKFISYESFDDNIVWVDSPDEFFGKDEIDQALKDFDGTGCIGKKIYYFWRE